MENKFQKEITATSAHVKQTIKLHVEMKCVDALTKVQLYLTVNKSLLMMDATHAPVKDQQEQ